MNYDQCSIVSIIDGVENCDPVGCQERCKGYVPCPPPSPPNADVSLGLGIGFGIGVPITALLILLLWCCRRRRGVAWWERPYYGTDQPIMGPPAIAL